MNYCKDYINLIYDGLDRMIVSDNEGNNIGIDKGFDIWVNKAYEVREKTCGLIFFCGNGASASMAEHMSHDWFQSALINTTTCSEVSHITAISNDISYEDVYSYRVNRILSDRDIFVGISSSGNSSNIVKAFDAANENGAFTISISGMKENNTIRKKGDINFYIPLKKYGEVESAHAVLLHAVLDFFLDKYMGERH